MDDRFNNDEQNKRAKKHSFVNEPKYEIEPTKEDIDEIFSDRSSIKPTNPKNAKFSVNIPDDNDDIMSSQSRVPKGKPVGNPPKEYQPYYDKNMSVRPAGSSNPAVPSQRPRPTSDISSNRTIHSNTDSTRPTAKQKKGKRKKNTGKKIALTVVSLILVVLIALFGYGYSILGKINYDESKREPNKYINSSELISDSKVKNILLIGSDARSEIAGMRSDTMMLCSIDTKSKKIKLTSFLRDSYVCIPTTGAYRKLNAACSSGGQQLVIDTIEYNFKVKIDSYILVDFEAFTKFIDTLGGLDIDGVTEKEVNYLKKNVQGINIKPGKNHLTGGATLWYSRIRYLDNDFYRTERQRRVISALIAQISKTNPATTMKALDTIMPMISTDISRNEFLSLGLGAVVQYLHYDIEQRQVPADGTWTNVRVSGEGDVLKMNIEENTKILKEFIYEK